MSATVTQTASDVASNVIPVDFRTTAPVLVDFDAASSPKSETAQRIAADAVASTAKLGSRDKKTGVLRALSNGRGDSFDINPYLIKIKAGWNSRNMTDPENLAHIDWLARSIAVNGVLEPLTVSLEGNEVFVDNGHSRLLATFRAIEVYGAEIKAVTCIAEGRYASPAERLLSQIVRNSGKPLTVTEQGAVFVKLLAFKWTVEQIAERTTVSVVRVKQILDLMAGATETVLNLVNTGKIAPSTAALALQRSGNDGEAAERELLATVENAAAAGKMKATPKHMPSTKATKEKAEKASDGDKKQTAKKLFAEIFAAKSTEVDTTDSDEDKVTITISASHWRLLADVLGL